MPLARARSRSYPGAYRLVHTTNPQLPSNSRTPSPPLQPNSNDSTYNKFHLVIKRLKNRMRPCASSTSDDVEAFLPKNALTDVLTDENICWLLKQRHETNRIMVADIKGQKPRVKIFAILLLMDAIEHIGHIIQNGLSDEDLPFGLKHFEQCKGSSAYSRSSQNSSSDEQSLGSSDSRSHYGTVDPITQNFQHYQFLVDVPTWTFSADKISKKEYHLHQKMPFLKKEKLSSGGQGTVWKVRIHKAHYQTKIQSVI